jgi:sugar/nucleoside kinase (ribokinase family)
MSGVADDEGDTAADADATGTSAGAGGMGTGTGPAPVLVMGDLMVDVMALLYGPLVPNSDSPGRITMRGGGSAANTACWLASVGIETVLIGSVGMDMPGRAAVDALREQGVRLSLKFDADRPTGTVVVLVDPDGERTMVPDAGANSGLLPKDLPTEEFSAGRHLHLSGYTLLNPESRGAGIAALELARSRGMTTSVDVASAGPLAEVGPERFLDWIGNPFVLFANRDEAAVLTGIDDPAEATRALTELCDQVVVKLGAEGVVRHDALFDRSIRVPAVEVAVVDVVDTTGAGDAFAAGYLAAWMRDADPEDALAAGCELAARVIRQVGGRP